MFLTSSTVLLAVALCVTAVAAIFDYRTGEIPNALTFGTLAIGPPLHIGLSMIYEVGPQVPLTYAILSSLSGALICALVPFALWKSGALGGGDLKLFAALGALLGLQRGLEVQLLTFVTSLVLLPTLLAWRGKLSTVLKNAVAIAGNLVRRSEHRKIVAREEMTEVRFGPAIFAGTLVSAGLAWLS